MQSTDLRVSRRAVGAGGSPPPPPGDMCPQSPAWPWVTCLGVVWLVAFACGLLLGVEWVPVPFTPPTVLWVSVLHLCGMKFSLPAPHRGVYLRWDSISQGSVFCSWVVEHNCVVACSQLLFGKTLFFGLLWIQSQHPSEARIAIVLNTKPFQHVVCLCRVGIWRHQRGQPQLVSNISKLEFSSRHAPTQTQLTHIVTKSPLLPGPAPSGPWSAELQNTNQ